MPGSKGQQDAAIALRDTIGKASGDISETTAAFQAKTAELAVQGAHAMDDVDSQYSSEFSNLGHDAKPVTDAKPDETPAASSSGAGTKRSRIQDALGPKPKRVKMDPKDTPEGKAQRWDRYQKRMSAKKMQDEIKAGKRRKALDYDAWSNVYDANIFKAEDAAEAVRDYAGRNGLTEDAGWKEEHNVSVGSKKRRIDLANPDTNEGIEYKSGSVPNDEKTAAELKHDVQLINRGWNIKWVFKTSPAPWLEQQLKDKGIPWELDR